MYHQLNGDTADPTDRPGNQQTVAQAILSAAERPRSLGMPPATRGGPALVTPTAMRPYPSYRAPSQSTMNPSAAAMPIPMSMAPPMNSAMPMPMPIPAPYMMEGYPPSHAHASSYPPYPYPAYPPPAAYPSAYGAQPVPAYSQVCLFPFFSTFFFIFFFHSL
jgi:hypothetical protein